MKYIFAAKRVPCFRRWQRSGWAAFASLHRVVTIGVLSVTMSILLLSAQCAAAQAVDTVSTLRSLQIAAVGVTGTPNAPAPLALAKTTLFDRKAQAAAPVQTLEAALRLAPSVDLRERGGKGAQADIAIRGGSFDQTMLLLNGIDFSDARTGHQSHALPVDLELISAIELIDGLPGVGAYAGAVNIRTAPVQSNYLRLKAEGGSHGYGCVHLSGAVSGERFSLLAALSGRRSDGYRHNTDFRTGNAYLRGLWETRRAGRFEFQAGYQAHEFGSNGFYAAYNPDQWEATSTALSSVRWQWERGRTTVGASVSYRLNFDRYDWTRGTPMNRHRTDNAGATLRVDRQWRGGTTSVGGNYAFNHIYSTNLGEPLLVPEGGYTCAKARHTGNLWLQHRAVWRRFDALASAGLSLTPYGETGLWNLSAGFRPNEAWHLQAGVAQSMRLPTFTDLYYTSPAHVNNLDLRPEHAVTVRLSADWQRGGWYGRAESYYRAGRDVIDWVRRPEMEGKWHSEQSSRLDTWGLELAGGWRSGEGLLRAVTASYGYITTDRNTDIEAQSAMDFMRHKGVLSVELHLLRRCSLVVTGSFYDRNGRYTDFPVAGDSKTQVVRDYAPYGLLDARVAWEKGICRLYLDATNLTGTRYCDMGGIPLPGRWFTAGMTLTVGR